MRRVVKKTQVGPRFDKLSNDLRSIDISLL